MQLKKNRKSLGRKRIVNNSLAERAPKKPLTNFRPMIRSRHPSHAPLRKGLPYVPFRSVVRLGSTTIEADAVSLGGKRVECNTVQSVKNSASKLLMKQCFTRHGVKTADWYTYNVGADQGFRNKSTMEYVNINDLPYPIIAKSHHGSRGEGNTKLDTKEQLENWMRGKALGNYIFERFYTYSREYRLHVTSKECFYTCRKMLRRNAEEGNKWQRHDDNCVWIREENADFNKPVNWEAIVADCIKALNAVGLDIGAFDVKVQSANDSRGRRRENPEWIVIESCSAPSFGEITLQKYIEEIPKVLKRKYGIGI